MSEAHVTISARAPASCDVAICGGGLGGLALAAGLVRRGYDVHVFEAATQLRTATSTLIGMGGNGFKALSILHPEIVPKLRERGALTLKSSTTIRPSKSAEAVHASRPPRGEMVTIRWSEVQLALAELVPSELVHCDHKATGYTELAEEGLVRVHFKGKQDVVARLVVGADGVRSAIRARMYPNDPGPRYLGHMNWNALLHNPGGNTVVDAHTPGELQLHSDVQPFTRTPFNVFTFVIDAGGGYTFWQVRTRSEQPSFTPSPGEEVEVEGKAQGDSDMLRHDTLPQLAGGGLGRPGSKARVEKILAEYGLDHALKVVQATDESAIFERVIMDRVPLDELGATLHSAGGRVVLLGDAAHAMHSSAGQGARTAFEDACVLATLLDQHRGRLVGWQGAGVGEAEAAPDTGGADGDGVMAVATEYNEARLVRVCRIQRVAASGCGLQPLRDKLYPGNLSDEELAARAFEFGKWLDQFPDKPSGDPDSTYWKPPASSA